MKKIYIWVIRDKTGIIYPEFFFNQKEIQWFLTELKLTTRGYSEAFVERFSSDPDAE